ncbi:transcriptional regulator CynR [Tundrisphaera sp. TA3]|uniref:transcriptional regulator CynR n=1 Tax=Tundrisphaera sp. TA3 TaxID=3435775 RepID=UPI003EB7F4B9
MELRHLRYFLAVCEDEHVTRAAERLDVSQPTLSQQIRQLEDEVGAPLFERIGRRLRLASAGEIFREHARRALREMEDAVVAIRELEGLRRGRVVVGTVQTANVYLIPGAVARLTAAHPGLFVRVEELSAGEIAERLAAGRIDLGISFAPADPSEVEAEDLFDEELVLVVPDGHRLARRKRVGAGSLEGERLVLMSAGFSTRRLVDEYLEGSKARPVIAVEMNSIEGILATVRSSGAATILPALALGEGVGGLRSVGLDGPTPRRTVSLLWRRGAYRSHAARAFAAEVARFRGRPPGRVARADEPEG